MIDAPYPPTLFGRCAMAIYHHEATQPFPSFANWRRRGQPETRCRMSTTSSRERRQDGHDVVQSASLPSGSDVFLTRQVRRHAAARRLSGAKHHAIGRTPYGRLHLQGCALVRTCVIKALVAERKAAPGAVDMCPAEALEQIVSANGFISENHYDSDDLPKSPHAEGDGEADAPQHCDGCGQFLGNPLTVDGLICVENMILDYLRTKKVSGAAADAVIEWADFYKDEIDFRRIVLEALKG
jgi:hypothetical protein